METEDKQNRKLRPTWIGISCAIIGLVAVSAIVRWPQLSLQKPTDVIIIKAIDGPIKVKPLDPGGTTVMHQDLLVIDMLKSGVANTGEVETLQPNFSKPEPPPIVGGKTEDKTVDGVAMAVAAENTPSASNEETKTAKEETSQQKNLKKTSKKRFVNQKDESAIVIQLAAFRSVKKAEEIASLLSAKHDSRLDGIQLQTMRFDTGSNGIFFRVVSPPLRRVEAEAACANLRRAGQDCFLRKFTAPEG